MRQPTVKENRQPDSGRDPPENDAPTVAPRSVFQEPTWWSRRGSGADEIGGTAMNRLRAHLVSNSVFFLTNRRSV